MATSLPTPNIPNPTAVAAPGVTTGTPLSFTLPGAPQASTAPTPPMNLRTTPSFAAPGQPYGAVTGDARPY